jgi:hypothetical protein
MAATTSGGKAVDWCKRNGVTFWAATRARFRICSPVSLSPGFAPHDANASSIARLTTRCRSASMRACIAGPRIASAARFRSSSVVRL